MSNLERQEADNIQVDIDQAIVLGEALKRLELNPDFKLVFLDGYLSQGVKDSVSLLGLPSIKKQNLRADIMEDLVSASNLQYHLSMIHQFHAGALVDEDLEADEGTE